MCWYAAPLRLLPNVIVRLALGNQGFRSLQGGHGDFGTGTKPLLRLFRGWLRVADDVRVYEGSIETGNFMPPYPNYFAIAARIKEFAELGIKGYFGEGQTTGVPDMKGLRGFLIGRLLFDPSLSIGTLVARYGKRHACITRLS